VQLGNRTVWVARVRPMPAPVQVRDWKVRAPPVRMAARLGAAES